MTLSQSVCDVLRDHVVLESECVDRMYLNVYVPQLQRVGGVVWYLRGHLGQRFASTATVAPKTEAFVANIERFVAGQGVDLVSFGKHQRKDDVTQQYLQRFDADEGILYVGRAQEKARVVRTERRRCARTGMSYPWVVDGSAMVNHYYFYCMDEDFGPFFLKFCSYFPYTAKLCINGNEYAKCQLRKRGIAFEALDNGILSCEDPKALQRICDGLDDRKIDRLLRKWLRTNGEPVITYLQPASAPMGKRIQSETHFVQGFPLAIQVLRDDSFVLAHWRAFSINVLVRTALIATVIAMLAFLLIKLLRSLQGVIEQLRSSEQRWRAVFEHAPIGVLVLHAHSNYLMANPAFERMLGYSREELAQLRAIDITHPDDIEVTKSNIDDLVTGRCDSVRFQKRYLHRDGHVVWTDMSIARVFAIHGPAAQSGRPTEHMLIATAEDITQRLDDEDKRRRLEDQLRQSQKLEALGTFAGGVAHDFNNILGAILGYGERALSVLGEGTPERRYVDQMTRAGDRARLLVERILTFSRSGMTARVHVHLQPVVAEAIELLKGTLPATIKLDVRLDADDAFAMGDATHAPDHHEPLQQCGSCDAPRWRAWHRACSRALWRPGRVFAWRVGQRRLCPADGERYRHRHSRRCA
ncbi:PAS domain S-box-containing protein [Paraburkholderia sp. CI2]|nr:PAS domain S-box-containing protein [Paraburkholderia sp. CI2]